MLIIGITGTLGAGKGTIVDYLVKTKDFLHFSARAFVTEEIVRKHMIVNRDSMRLVANDLRKKHSPSYIIDELYKMAQASGKNSIIESVRTPGEVLSLRQKGNFYLFAVDADPEERFRRIQLRASETDNVSFDRFIQNEEEEMKSTDPNKQNIGKCIEMANFCFLNEGSIGDIQKQVDKVLMEITNN